MKITENLDVTVLEPRIKHATIFGKIDNLKADEAIIIHNDHDPLPLYYQLKAQYPNQFTWEYLLAGPEIWEVQILKIGSTLGQLTVGEIVASDYRKADVFSKYNIDFCCGGKVSLETACNKANVKIETVEGELKSIENRPLLQSQNFNN